MSASYTKKKKNFQNLWKLFDISGLHVFIDILLSKENIYFNEQGL